MQKPEDEDKIETSILNEGKEMAVAFMSLIQ